MMKGMVETFENWVVMENPSSSSITQVEQEQEDVEEALSLCDLPISQETGHHQSLGKESKAVVIDPTEDFNFCSWPGADSCVADEVFFQGQILPMRHSVNFDSAAMASRSTITRCHSRSESMDHHSSSYSVGFTSLSSRSSSINSHHSSSSGSNSSAATVPKTKPRCPKMHNQFQFSQSSPKPQIRSSKVQNTIGGHINPNRNSTFWSFLRVGLVTAPEIGKPDLKLRSKSGNNFGSRSSSSSSINSSFSNKYRRIKEGDDNKKQRQYKFLGKNRVFFSSCRCSSNAVVGPIPCTSRAPINAVTRNSSTKEEAHAAAGEDNSGGASAGTGMEKKDEMIRTTKHETAAGKQSLSRHRTFEWLKQLSLEAAVVIDQAAEQNQQ